MPSDLIKPDQIEQAHICLGSQRLSADLEFFIKTLGFRLNTIFPADNPRVATLSGFGISIKLDVESKQPAGKLELSCRNFVELAPDQRTLTAPNGTQIEFVAVDTQIRLPTTAHELVVRPLVDSDSWVIGRAGMQYRDLIPSRLGDVIIASHIRIPEGGPVPDMVHYHEVGFQLIYCYRGWVKVVYEGQGEPIILRAGDCVIQPPEIRHRVLESGDDLQVLEIGVPAEHITKIDHNMTLPSTEYTPERVFNGSQFVHHVAADIAWDNCRLPSFTSQKTGIARATQNVADVQIYRPSSHTQSISYQHDCDILFTFVKEGAFKITAEYGGTMIDHLLKSGDAFVIPPDVRVTYSDFTKHCEFIEVSLAGRFKTTLC